MNEEQKCTKKWYGYKHNYGNWKKLEVLDTSRLNGQIVAQTLIQERVCKDCGFIARNSQKYVRV